MTFVFCPLTFVFFLTKSPASFIWSGTLRKTLHLVSFVLSWNLHATSRFTVSCKVKVKVIIIRWEILIHISTISCLLFNAIITKCGAKLLNLFRTHKHFLTFFCILVEKWHNFGIYHRIMIENHYFLVLWDSVKSRNFAPRYLTLHSMNP